MSPRILHHKEVMVPRGLIISEIEYPLWFFVCYCMFTPLQSSTNLELFEKYVYNQSSHYVKIWWCHAYQLSSDAEVSISSKTEVSIASCC